METLSFEDLKAAFVNYVCYDLESADTDYVRSVLQDVCGLNAADIEDLGLGGILPDTDITYSSTHPTLQFDDVLSAFQCYVDNDLAAADPGYVRYVLTDICGLNPEEMKQCGFGYLVPDKDEECL